MAKDQKTLRVIKSPNPRSNTTVFIGALDKEVIDLTKQAFPEHEIYVMSKDTFNRNVQLFSEQNAKFKEAADMVEFVKKPDNIKTALQQVKYCEESMKDVMDADGWFTLADLVKATRFDHKQAQSVLDLLFHFGLAVTSEKRKNRRYKLTATKREKLEYMTNLRVELHATLYDYDEIILMVAKESRLEENIPIPSMAVLATTEELKMFSEKIADSDITELEKEQGMKFLDGAILDCDMKKQEVEELKAQLENVPTVKADKATEEAKEGIKSNVKATEEEDSDKG